MKTDKYSLLAGLRQGRVSKNRHFRLLTNEPECGTYHLYQRLRGLSRRLSDKHTDISRIERTPDEEICIEISGLPGGGSERALLRPAEARALTDFSIPQWARARIARILGGT